MATRGIEMKMISLINNPETTIDTLRHAYTTKASKLKCTTLHFDVMNAALKRNDTDMIDFVANEAGVTGGVRSTVMTTAFFREVSDAALDVLDRAFQGKNHRETMNGFVSSSFTFEPNAAACFERAFSRYGEPPTKSAITALISKTTMSQFEIWHPLILKFFNPADLKNITIDWRVMAQIVRYDVANWEQRFLKMEELGFVFDIDHLRSSLRIINDEKYNDFVKKRVRKRAALRSAITKKKSNEAALKLTNTH